MKLLTPSQLAKLIRNGERSQREPDFDPHPVVKLFTPDAQCTWPPVGDRPDGSRSRLRPLRSRHRIP